MKAAYVMVQSSWSGRDFLSLQREDDFQAHNRRMRFTVSLTHENFSS